MILAATRSFPVRELNSFHPEAYLQEVIRRPRRSLLPWSVDLASLFHIQPDLCC